MRRLLLAVAIILLILFGAFLAAVSLINVNKYRPQIEAELQSRLGVPVKLGQMHLHIFPVSIRVDGITVDEPPQFPSQRPLATATEVYASASLWPLIQGHPAIKNLTLNNPQIELIQNPAGAWNFSRLGANNTGTAQPAGAGKSSAPMVPLDRLQITNGQLAVTEEKSGQPRTVYKNINLTLSNFVPGQQFDVNLDMHFPGPGKELLTFSGKGGPLEPGNTAPMPVGGHLVLEQVDLKSFAPEVNGELNANLTASGTVNDLLVQGTLSSPGIQAQGLTLTNVHANCSMKNGVAELSPITATVYGGQENGTITVDTKPAHPVCSVKTKLSGVDTNALLAAVSSVKDTLYGSLATDANLNFTIGAAANLAQTLNGTLAFNVTNGKLAHINILTELSRIGKFLNSAPVQNGTDTALQKLSGTFDVKNGLATTNNLIAALDAGSLSAKGSVNLVNEGLDMHMTAVLGSAFSKTVGGSGIGGFLNTALANNQGELVLPVTVTGTLQHPVFTPDVQDIAQMKLKHLLPTTGNPAQSTSGLVGSVLNGVLGQQNGKQSQQNPLSGILNSLGKKKQ